MALSAHPVRHLLLSALLSLLAACAQPADQVQAETVEIVAGVREDTADIVVPAAAQVRASTVEVLVPLLLDAREIVQEALPEPAPIAQADVWAGAPAATALIVRWEVSSPQLYTRRYQGVICPGGASGPTIGVGYDLGHQTTSDIARDWAAHPDAGRLAAGSAQVGEARCRAYQAKHRDIRVPFAMAQQVFATATLPAYHAAARRALAQGWDGLSLNAQAADISLGYNRGWSMRGDRNREKRAIRDTCVPAADLPCNASELRAMCRLWAGTPNGKGLCARRDAEARLLVSA